MTSKVYEITDLGLGEGGKGGVVQTVAYKRKAHTIIKVGGGHGSHGVKTSRGESFAYSHYGCGTFDGIRTHLSNRFNISPEGILNESDALRYSCGIHNPYELLTIDETCLCATLYHGMLSRIREMSLGRNSRGTVGTGIGVAYRYASQHPELTLFARDLNRRDLRDRMAAVRDQVRKDLEPLMTIEFLPEDQDEVNHEMSLLNSDGFLDYATMRFWELAKLAKIVDPDYMGREILSKAGVAVVESSHGVLADKFHGFHPHTSAIRTLPRFAQGMLRAAGYEGEIVNIAVHRAYEIRHGAGPMPTADPTMNETLLPGSHKKQSRYQGEVMVGALDMNLIRYALNCCGGPSAFQGLALTWFDQIQKNGIWHICDGYENANDPEFFTPSGDLKVHVGEDKNQLNYQENLGRALQKCQPVVSSIVLPSSLTEKAMFDWIAGVLVERLQTPVRMVSFGPTEQDKTCK